MHECQHGSVSPACLHLVAERGVDAQVPVDAGDGRQVPVPLLHSHPAVTGAHRGGAVPGGAGTSHIGGHRDLAQSTGFILSSLKKSIQSKYYIMVPVDDYFLSSTH